MNNSTSNTIDGLLLPGLDGTNPLGFLAALGLFQALDGAVSHDTVLMTWASFGGTWVPVVQLGSGTQLIQGDVLNALEDVLEDDFATHPMQIMDQLTNRDSHTRTVLRDKLEQATRTDRGVVDSLVALGSDFASADATSQLQLTRRDYYRGNLTSVIKLTSRDHLQRSIFRPWDYSDPLHNQSLHLDPGEDRRHAHQWNKPAGDPDRKKSGGMLGANRLAIEAFPLFTSFPKGDKLCTVGFTGNRSRDTRWTWPVWEAKLPLPVIRSLLSMLELQASTVNSNEVALLRDRGVVAVFRTHRILVGKTPNFTPSQRVA